MTTVTTEARASRVRTGCQTAKVRALREQCRVDVWYSMNAMAPALGSPGEECVWVRTPDEGRPSGSHIVETPDESAFILCYYDERGEIHIVPPRFGWYKDLTFQGIAPMFMCGQCGDRCSDETHGGALCVRTERGDRSRPEPQECDSCKRPVRMPGL